MGSKIIGKVTATEKTPTSCNKVQFWVQHEEIIRPFDIVRIPHIKGSFTYAIVQDLKYITDSAGHLANYVSSDFGDIDASPQNHRLGTTIAEAEVLYNDMEIEMPVIDGAAVEWADVEGIKVALGINNLKVPIPAGYFRISNGIKVPIEFEAQYLIGPEGAHLNIAGISGLATKTSYAMFLLTSLQQKMGNDISIVIFNVKGRDLLSIDEPNDDILDKHKQGWKDCGLIPKPFENVTYLYPYSQSENKYFTQSHIDQSILNKQINEDRAYNYFYDVETGRHKLALLFSDIDDPNSTMESMVHAVPEINANSWDSFKQEVKEKTEKGSGKSGDISVLSWRKFNRLLKTRTENDIFTEKNSTKIDLRRQKTVEEAISKIKKGKVLVIDIEPLPNYLQCLVFGDVIQSIWAAKLGDIDGLNPSELGTVVVFADELNKYAPKTAGDTKTLTRDLLEITERGRSFGVVLFGAEQFRSGVHERILGNCGTNVFGRTSPVEISRPDYRYFSENHKTAITRLPPGNLLLQHVIFKTSLIKIEFPFPCYYQPKG